MEHGNGALGCGSRGVYYVWHPRQGDKVPFAVIVCYLVRIEVVVILIKIYRRVCWTEVVCFLSGPQVPFVEQVTGPTW